jgi:hypothetical protein
MFGKSTKYLPENYQHYKTLDIHNFKAMVFLNLLAIGMLILTIYLSNHVIKLLRPDISVLSENVLSIKTDNILHIFGVSIIVIVIHELIHGIFFWIYTNDRPTFAFKLLYAYAAAPEWFIPKVNFIVIGLSPAIIITIMVTFLIMIVPSSWIKIVSLAGIINFAGSTGDFVVIIWILTFRYNLLVRDSGDAFDVYYQHTDLRENNPYFEPDK